MMPKTKAGGESKNGGGGGALDHLREQLPFLAIPDQKVFRAKGPGLGMISSGVVCLIHTVAKAIVS